jgi:hypothetical protein
MDNRIKEIKSPQTWDCRSPCFYGMKKLETVIFNRGVETIGDGTFGTYEHGLNNHPRDLYVSKYVKKLNPSFLRVDNTNNSSERTVHFEVSFEDYKNNNYDYTNLADDNGFKLGLYVDVNKDHKGIIANDIDDYYVSINDNTAPKEIEVNGVTLYLYETYKTNGEGQAKVSLPNDPNIDYYVKEIVPPEGFELDPNAYKIDMTQEVLNIIVQNLSTKDALSQLATNPDESTQDNPLTADFIMILVTLFILSFLLIIYNYKKGRKLI